MLITTSEPIYCLEKPKTSLAMAWSAGPPTTALLIRLTRYSCKQQCFSVFSSGFAVSIKKEWMMISNLCRWSPTYVITSVSCKSHLLGKIQDPIVPVVYPQKWLNLWMIFSSVCINLYRLQLLKWLFSISSTLFWFKNPLKSLLLLKR